jgi:hypothetical protein
VQAENVGPDPKGARWAIRDLDDVGEHVGDSPNFQTLYIDPATETELVETRTSVGYDIRQDGASAGNTTPGN